MSDGLQGGLERFGQYILLERIGDGGMAEIFLAKMEGNYGFEKLVALKRILPRYSAQPVFARMLIHEAKLAAAIQHLNVVQVLDLGDIDGQVFIAMEYVKGRDLAALLSRNFKRRERLPIALALFIVTEFLSGLEYAHRLEGPDGLPLGLIHRDVSPQNVLISYEGEVKVTDFGIARVLNEEDRASPGYMHGKFGYMAPEQVRRLQMDQRADIFAAGVVLYETLIGKRLFRSKDPKQASKLVLTKDVVPPSTINPEIPPAIDRICAKALERERDERYQTIGAMLGDLSRVADDLPRRAARRDLAVYMRRAFGTLRAARARRGRSVGGRSQVGQLSGSRQPLGEILIDMGAIEHEDLDLALAQQRARGGRIGEIFLESGVLGEGKLAKAIAQQANVPLLDTADLKTRRPDQELLRRFPREVADGACVLPIAASANGSQVELATSEPFDSRALLETKVVLGVSELQLRVASHSVLRATIDAWYESLGTDDLLDIGDADSSGEVTNESISFESLRDVDVATKPGRSSVPPPMSSSGHSVSGRLAEMSALDIVHTLENTGTTADVTIVYDDGRHGRMAVIHGEVRGCATDRLHGEDAFFELMKAGEGLFRIEYNEPDMAPNISLPNTLLMLEAIAAADAPVTLREQNLAPTPGSSLVANTGDTASSADNLRPVLVAGPGSRAHARLSSLPPPPPRSDEPTFPQFDAPPRAADSPAVHAPASPPTTAPASPPTTLPASPPTTAPASPPTTTPASARVSDDFDLLADLAGLSNVSERPTQEHVPVVRPPSVRTPSAEQAKFQEPSPVPPPEPAREPVRSEPPPREEVRASTPPKPQAAPKSASDEEGGFPADLIDEVLGD